MAAILGISVLRKLVDYTISPVVRQFGYLYHYEDNVKHLTSQVEMLNAKRADVNLLVQAATDNLEVIASEVNTWLANVDGIIQDKETFFEEGKTAKATCSNVWFPNLKVRHSLSRKAKKMTPDVDNLLLVGNFSQVSCPAPPLKIRFPSTGEHIEFESRKKVVRRVMKALTNDQINPIVICGMGGIGKTTLVKEIGAKAREAGLFDEVAIAFCAQVLDVSKIQDDVAEFLRLKLTEASSLQARANKLTERLSGPKKVLVILDNVWSLPDLSVIGIPCDCKLLVSTRNQNVFNRIETKKNFPVGTLPKDDAWSLFKKMAGASIESDLELRPIAEEVLSECDGLPIAISTLGGALREKKKPVWKDALRRLQKPFPGDSLGMENNVYKTIKLSYDYLESEVKSCFLLCCLFPESSNILLHDLVIYGLGLGLFQGIDSMEGGRDRVEALVDTLRSCYLLLDSNEKECVRMHDVVRDVALYIASNRGQDRFVVWHEVELKDWPKTGLSGQYTSTLLETTAGAHRCTDLLLLSCMNKESWKPPATILQGMENLKVLDIRNASLLPILPSVQLLKNLQTLRLEYCYSDWTVASAVIVELRTLMILSLRGSDIEQLPDEFKNLSNLRLLDLTGCSNLKIISPGVVSSFSRLEELYMWYSFQEIQVGEKRRFSQMATDRLEELYMWYSSQEIQVGEKRRFSQMATDLPANRGQLDKEEVQISGQKDEHTIISQLFSLHCLTSLDIFLPSIDKLRNSLLFHKLERFKISVGLKHDIILNPNHSENYLRLDDLDENSLVGSGVNMLLKKTDTLELKMRNLADPLNIALGTECCINLKSLRLEECDALICLIDMTCNAPRSVFPVLNLLRIEGGSRLKEICHSKLPMGSLEKLRELSLYDLPTLTHFWKMESHNECLGNLRLVEVLDIRRCQSFEEIVALEGSGHHEEVAWEFNFLNLTTLTLEDLPSFIGISKTSFFVGLPQLIRLELKNLPELGSICSNGLAPESSSDAAIQHLHDPKVKKSFIQLRYVSVKSCKKLSGVFSSNFVQNLRNVEEIEVRNCSSLKTVFEFEGLEIKEIHVSATLSFLKRMDLVDLPLLEYVWKPPQHIMAFHNLGVLKVMQCNRLRYVFPLFVVEGLTNLASMYVIDCQMMEEIIANNEEAGGGGKSTNRIALPRIHTLQLEHLPCLTWFCPAACPKMSTFFSPAVPTGSGRTVEVNASNLQFLFNEKVDFPILRQLILKGMSNFKEIWSNQLSPYSFCELVYLDVSFCSALLCLVPTCMQHRLQNLERIEVFMCSSLEDIFEPRRFSVNEDERDAVSISQSGEAPSNISQPDQRMRIIVNNTMGSKQSHQGFQNLTSIVIVSCRSLRNLVSPFIARGLVKLKKLTVRMCPKLEEIVTAEGEEADDNSMLPLLSSLELRGLPSLTSFTQGKYTFEWPCMEEVTVSKCPKMNNFCLGGSLSTPGKVRIWVNDVGEDLLQELNNSRKET